MIQNLLIAAIFTLFVVVIAVVAWFYTMRFVILERIQKVENDSSKLTVLETRQNVLENKPDTSSDTIKKFADQLSILESNVSGVKREMLSMEESLRRMMNKIAGRTKRETEPEAPGAGSAKATYVPVEQQTLTVDDLVKNGHAVPLSAPVPPVQKSTFGQIAR